MFKQGDYIMYSNHGACLVDEIRERIIDKEKKMYYILHPLNENNSKIMTPINNSKVRMRAIMTPKDAEIILSTIANSKVTQILDKKQREQAYTKILKEGNPNELVEIINALVIEENEKISEGKKASDTDRKYLVRAEKLLYSELSVTLNIKFELIKERVACMFKKKI